MTSLLPEIDPDGLLEYSVVFTDRSLNHMSKSFQSVMRDISSTLKRTYGADAAIVVPGGGTYAMEAVARQFATNARCLVIRNGFFSYRWSQIFDAGDIPAEQSVLQARPVEAGDQAALEPCPIEKVVDEIATFKPDLVFAPHVETASGMLLHDDYLAAVADATHESGGLFVLDCVASGALWVNMREIGVDILISAPQKGWSASPCSGFVMLGAEALDRIATTTSSSFACDLKKWLEIMSAYENGGHAYHATMPTDALVQFSDSMKETEEFGLEKSRIAQQELGYRVRSLLSDRGFKSVAAEGFQSPTVVVCHTDDVAIQNGSKFAAQGLQIAAGVPLMCDEPADYRSFRIGLFGLDKIGNVDRTVANLKQALDVIADG
ncbi:MAG: aminotransferase class V-fold PLP-dependent enzyme [Woeseiaceae bacterium]